MRTLFSMMLYNIELLIMSLGGVMALGATVFLASDWHTCELELVFAVSTACCAVAATLMHCVLACTRKQSVVGGETLLHRDVALALVAHMFLGMLAYFLLYSERGGFKVTLCAGVQAPFAVTITLLSYICAFGATPENKHTPLWVTPECLLFTGCVLFCLLHEGAVEVLALLPDVFLETHVGIVSQLQNALPFVSAEDGSRLAACVWFLPVVTVALLGTAAAQDMATAHGTDESLLLIPRCARLFVSAMYLAVTVAAPTTSASGSVFAWICVGLLGASMLLQVIGLRLSAARLISDGLLIAGCVLFCLTHTDTEAVAAMLPFSLGKSHSLVYNRLGGAIPSLNAATLARVATCVWFLPVAVAVLLVTAVMQDILTANAANEGWVLFPRVLRLTVTTAYLAVVIRATMIAAITGSYGWVCVGLLAGSALIQLLGLVRNATKACARPALIPAAAPADYEKLPMGKETVQTGVVTSAVPTVKLKHPHTHITRVPL